MVDSGAAIAGIGKAAPGCVLGGKGWGKNVLEAGSEHFGAQKGETVVEVAGLAEQASSIY